MSARPDATSMQIENVEHKFMSEPAVSAASHTSPADGFAAFIIVNRAISAFLACRRLRVSGRYS
jgi:hypothetical protein